MPKTKHNVKSHRRKKKILKLAKGYRGGRSKLIKTAKVSVEKALLYAYRDRKKRKSDFRKLWISRINAAVRQYGLSYSSFISSLKKNNILIDRKILAHIAITDPVTFQNIVKKIEG